MNIMFDVKQQELQHKAIIVVEGHVMDSTDYTTY